MYSYAMVLVNTVRPEGTSERRGKGDPERERYMEKAA